MKKKLFYTLSLILGLALTACKGDYTDWAAPQHNDPEAPIAFNFTAKPVATIDYGTLDPEQTSLQLFTLEGSDYYAYKVIINDQFTLDCDFKGFVYAEELKNIVETIYGKAPVERKLKAYVYGFNAPETADKGNLKKRSNDFEISVILHAEFIDQAYYLIGDFCGWSGDAMAKFEHAEGVSVYDDPTFTVLFETTTPNCYWKIIPQSNVDAGDIWKDGVVGVIEDGSSEMADFLTNTKPGAGKIVEPGKYRMVINMLEWTYEITQIHETDMWYLVGSCVGDGTWGNSPENVGVSLVPMTLKAGKLFYEGYLTGDGFKVIHTPGDWNEQWGEKDGKLVKNDSGSGNITVAAAGYYRITLDFMKDVMTIEPLETTPNLYKVTMAGEFNGWSDTAMNAVSTAGCLEGHNHIWCLDVDLVQDQGCKFKIEGSWETNWGSSDFPIGVGTNGGNNIVPTETGTYRVVFNDVDGGYIFIKK